MKSYPIILIAVLSAAPVLYAQVVNDGATNTLSNVTNNLPGNATVGTNGSLTLVVLSNNCLLTNFGTLFIGQNITARSNEVRLVSASARWLVGGDLAIGYNGAFNRLTISNGARVISSFGQMSVNSTTASNNTVVVTGVGSVWSNAADLNLGALAGGNRLEISDGGWVGNHDGTMTFGISNQVFVTGVGSVWSNRNDLILGLVRGGSQMVVSNGGMVFSRIGYLGQLARGSNNLALVTGSGSVWANTSDLYVGMADQGNQLVVSNGGVIVASNVFIGFQSAATNNRVVVDGGTLRVTNASGTAVLDVRRGTNVLNTGLIEVNQLLITNTAGRFVFNSGTLAAGKSTINNGQSFSVGNGVSPATMTLVGNGPHSFANGLNIQASAALTGNGSIIGNALVFLGGTLSPGASIGTMAFSNPLLSSGVIIMEISRNSSALTNDQLQVAGTLTYGGSLIVTNIGPTGLATGDNFKLFSASSFAGSFALIILPSLPSGLSWMDNLLTDGSIEVQELPPIPPTVQTTSATVVGATNATLNGFANPGGYSTRGWFEWGTNFPTLDNVTPAQSLGSGTNNFSFNQFLNSLPQARYFFRAAASNNFGVVFGNTLSFVIGLEVTTVGGTILSNSATLIGSANPRGISDTAGRFQWGIRPPGLFSAPFTDETPPQPVGSGNTFTNFSHVFSNLTAGTYQFRAVASNSAGLAVPGNGIFLFFIGPTVTTQPASAIGPTNAILNGLVNPRTNSTIGWFEWGTTTNYGNVTPTRALGSGNSDVGFSEFLIGLSPNTTHHFRALASNIFGVVFGANQSFLNPPPAQPGLITYLKASNTRVFSGGIPDEFGFSAGMSGDTVVVGALGEDSAATGVNGDQNSTSADGSGAVYVFVRTGTNWAQQAYLKASNTGVGDTFGNAVAISGDTIVVAARSEDSNATGVNGNGGNDSAPISGAAYVFVRSGTNWTQQAYLKASNTDANDFFGFSVSISGDTVIVGASQEDSNATGVNGNQSNNSALDSGAAYVFVRIGTNWTQQAYLKPSNTATGDLFGVSVSVSGDTAVVGSRFQDGIASNSGAAYVFVRNGTNWTQQTQLKAANAGADDEFGRRVAVLDNTIVVGAALEDSSATGVNGNDGDNSAPDSGAAYVFVRNGTNWTQQAYLKASNTGPGDNFGMGAVGISGDTVVVGALAEDSAAFGVNSNKSDNSATDSGAAYVFTRTGTNWSQQHYLKASNTELADRFGNWVVLSGNTVVVCADLERSAATGVNGDQSDNSAGFAGAVYVFDLSLLNPPTAMLSIAQSGVSQVTLSWMPPTPGFVLQESLNLAPMSWSNSPSGETNPITLPATEQTKFFRLLKQ